MKSTGLRWFEGKKYLSFVRGGDYTHPGEERAIDIAMARFPKNKDRKILDVGCGLGGTAKYIQSHGWGNVVGLDIDNKAITYARGKYPDVEFVASDVAHVREKLEGCHFDLFCLFSSFLVFPNQSAALRNLRSLAKDNAPLMIFEYTDLAPEGKNPFIVSESREAAFQPINLKTIDSLLDETGWECLEIKNLDREFEEWYINLLSRLEEMKAVFVAEFGERAFEQVWKRYSSFVDAYASGLLGGCVLYARPRQKKGEC